MTSAVLSKDTLKHALGLCGERFGADAVPLLNRPCLCCPKNDLLGWTFWLGARLPENAAWHSLGREQKTN